ncbi:type II toxin-antitoxin system YafQ family toxin [Campylobacter fetus]|uniref:type II toxin-antitoxin system YafQ family toxin n=1 Tax=Campylobacter fetus TaxID=196 RepID=UPI00122EE1E8|nr:type II toxin-antitoxin system YafQ family toxin [Campylobacter fetus]KAA3684591.1 type II toxin-antitoxin system YafQ family toxin [Campylobacter fetus subsp. fetus]
MLTIKFAKSFKKSYKKLSNDEKKIFEVVSKKLQNNEVLEPKYRDHALIGELKGYRECHLKPDLLLIYKKLEKELILYFLNIGSHSDLFK